MVKRLMSAVLKQKFLSGDENLYATPALWLPLRQPHPERQRRVSKGDPGGGAGGALWSAPFDKLRAGLRGASPSASLLSTRGLVRTYPLSRAARSRRSRRRAPEYAACGRG